MMKKQKNRLRKTLALVFSAVLLVAITVGATVAYLTSTDEVKNTFTVGNVQIALDEAKTNTEGKPIDKEGNVVDLTAAERVKANNYHLVPGRNVTKDPTVSVLANSERCYVRVFVKVSNWSAAKTVFVDPDSKKPVFDQMFAEVSKPSENNGGWYVKEQKEDETKDICTFELRYMKLDDENAEIDMVVPNSTNVQKLNKVFGSINVPGDTTDTDLAALNTATKKFEVEVVAEAIQAEGFANADAAWSAWPNT